MKIVIKRPGEFPEEKNIRDDENEALNDLTERNFRIRKEWSIRQ